MTQSGAIPSSDDEHDRLRRDIWDRAFYAFATAYIFEQRAHWLKRRLKWLTFVALVVPIVVGGVALAYGAGFPYLGIVVATGATIGLLQLVISAWAVVSQWVESHGYANISAAENHRLAREFKALGEGGSGDTNLLRSRYNVLKATDDARQAQDSSHGISENEKRMGHRAALRGRQRACANCGQTPTGMNPTDCDVCGNFKIRRI